MVSLIGMSLSLFWCVKEFIVMKLKALHKNMWIFVRIAVKVVFKSRTCMYTAKIQHYVLFAPRNLFIFSAKFQGIRALFF
jgi:hypothetical protein